MKKLLVVSFSDFRGGAAKAALQHVKAIKSFLNIDVKFIVAEKKLNSAISQGPTRFQSYCHLILRVISLFMSNLQVTRNKGKHSLNIFSSLHVKKHLSSNVDCVHLHWINNDTLSLDDISSFLSETTSLVIITLHDDWFFSGSEHCVEQNSNRYLVGYSKDNCDTKCLDLDRWTFKRKLKMLNIFSNENIIFTTPSRYLQKKAKNSLLLKNSKVVSIPNIINNDEFIPMCKPSSRSELKLPEDTFIILFGAVGGGSYLKGSDLLLSALERLQSSTKNLNITLVTFGGEMAKNNELAGYNIINLGSISSISKLSSLYSCADITIVPSRLESFGQVAAESLSCETPVIAFNNSGLTDIIEHKVSGMLVEAFDTKALCDSIVYMFGLSGSERSEMGRRGREHVIRKFSPSVVCEQWKNIYTAKK